VRVSALEYGQMMLVLVTADWAVSDKSMTLLEAFEDAIGDNDPDAVEDHPIWVDTMDALGYEYEDLDEFCEMSIAAADMVLRALRACPPGVLA